MSRTSTLVTTYLQAVIFAALGLRCVTSWVRERDKRSGHLALAAGFFGLSSLLGAVTTTFIDATKGEVAPRWEGIVSGILIYLSIYAFLLFLSDFVPYPGWVHGLVILVTLVSIIFSFIERPDLKFDPKTFRIVHIAGVHNPISYKTYLGIVLAYLAIAFGVLAVAFLLYGWRSKSLARFRMVSIGYGFLLLCIVIGLLPRLLFGNPSAATIKTVLNILTYIALISGPLLLVGFAPPKFVRRLFPESESQPVP